MKNIFRKKWISYVAAALSLSLIAAALGVVFQPLGGVGERVSRPFLRLGTGITAKVEQVRAQFADVEELRAENEALRQQVAELQQTLRQGTLALEENERLRTLLDLRAQGQKLTLEPAWVIGRTPDNWQGEVRLDRGSDKGLAVGQCVINGEHQLIGRIRETGPNWAAVRLLWDPAFQLTGQGTNSAVLGSAHGDLTLLTRGFLTFSALTSSDPVQLGETVVTFAAGGSYPSGLVIGTVTGLREEPGGLIRAGLVTPAADLSDLGQVFVVTDFWEEK